MATVTAPVPDAAITRPSTSRLGAPPVPTMSRESSVRPPSSQDPGSSGWPFPVRPGAPFTISAPVISASLHRGDHLDLVAVPQRRPRPGAPRHDLPVDGRRDPAGLASGPARDLAGDRGHQGVHRRAVGQLARFPVDGQPDAHQDLTPAVNRAGENGAHSARAGCPVSQAVTASAVTAESRIPLRKWPVAASSPSRPVAPASGPLSGVPGRSPAQASARLSSPATGSTLIASCSRSCTAPAVTVRSGPRSSEVAPTIISPSARGTRYTSVPRTVARTVRLSTGGIPPGSRSRSSWPLTGRTAAVSGSGSPASPPDQHPAATTTVSQPITSGLPPRSGA